MSDRQTPLHVPQPQHAGPQNLNERMQNWDVPTNPATSQANHYGHDPSWGQQPVPAAPENAEAGPSRWPGRASSDNHIPSPDRTATGAVAGSVGGRSSFSSTNRSSTSQDDRRSEQGEIYSPRASDPTHRHGSNTPHPNRAGQGAHQGYYSLSSAHIPLDAAGLWDMGLDEGYTPETLTRTIDDLEADIAGGLRRAQRRAGTRAGHPLRHVHVPSTVQPSQPDAAYIHAQAPAPPHQLHRHHQPPAGPHAIPPNLQHPFIDPGSFPPNAFVQYQFVQYLGRAADPGGPAAHSAAQGLQNFVHDPNRIYEPRRSPVHNAPAPDAGAGRGVGAPVIPPAATPVAPPAPPRPCTTRNAPANGAGPGGVGVPLVPPAAHSAWPPVYLSELRGMQNAPAPDCGAGGVGVSHVPSASSTHAAATAPPVRRRPGAWNPPAPPAQNAGAGGAGAAVTPPPAPPVNGMWNPPAPPAQNTGTGGVEPPVIPPVAPPAHAAPPFPLAPAQAFTPPVAAAPAQQLPPRFIPPVFSPQHSPVIPGTPLAAPEPMVIPPNAARIWPLYPVANAQADAPVIPPVVPAPVPQDTSAQGARWWTPNALNTACQPTWALLVPSTPIWPPPNQTQTPLWPQRFWTPAAQSAGVGSHWPRLHPLLTSNPNVSGYPILRWDIAHSPSTAFQLTARGISTKAKTLFSEKAMKQNPTTQTGFRIFIAAENTSSLGQWISQFWNGHIECAQPVAGQDLTVEDVLKCIHEFLHTRLRKAEYREIIKDSPLSERALNMAAQKRIKKSGLAEHIGRLDGLKRVDLLGDIMLFNGLELKYDPWYPGQWCACLHLVNDQNAGIARL